MSTDRVTIKSLEARKPGFMDRLRGAIKAAGKGFSFPAYGSYPVYSSNWPSDWPYNPLPGTVEDWESQAGSLWQNNAVSVCLNWFTDAIQTAPPVVRKSGTKDQKDIIVDHPLTALLRRPNPYYSGSRLFAATILDYKTRGNAYWFVVRDGAGRVTQLWYRPFRMVRPVWGGDGGEYISGYNYYVNGKNVPMKAEDVIHFAFGIDPMNERMGIKPLGGVTREIVQGNEASTYGVSVLRNSGAVSGVASPVNKDEGFAEPKQVKADLEAATTRENRARWLVSDVAMNVQKLNLSPEELALDKLAMMPVDFICAALGLDPMVVGLPSDRKTYSNLADATDAAWHRLQSMHRSFAEVLNTALDGDMVQVDGKSAPFDGAKQEVSWDYSEVAPLQPDRDADAKRVTTLFTARLLDRYTALSLLEMDATKEDKGVYYVSPQSGPDPNERTTDAQEPIGGSAGQLEGIPAIPGGNGKQPVTRGTG